MNNLGKLDQQYVWHPFTQMRDWLRQKPIVIQRGKGAVLWDDDGREYLDANSSIWTNLHGHGHPKINAAIRRQLKKVAHTSALGLANEPAALLAEQLVKAAALKSRVTDGRLKTPRLTKVFFSDDGSTAMEVALKLSHVCAQRVRHDPKPKFLSLSGAYHGDTAGAVSLGHIDLFHKAYGGLLFKSDQVISPYCYRCPFNRARPERVDAREYRRCRFECVDLVEKKFQARKKKKLPPYAAMIVEPLMQGAAGMIPQPAGWLRRVAEITRAHGTQLIADEVMTGFGRTGFSEDYSTPKSGGAGAVLNQLFACHHESVQPDFMAVAKGMTGGYLPMAATLTSQPVFDAFLGDYAEFKTFFHGHSFTGNQLGAAAALASLELLQGGESIQARRLLQNNLRAELKSLWHLPQVGDLRQVGLVAGIELVKNWRTRAPFDLRERAGIRVCEAMARRGVLTRPIGNVIVLMPPYCTTTAQLKQMVQTLALAIEETF